MGRAWGLILPPRVMEIEILNTCMLNEAGAGITFPIPVGTQYEITILPLSF